MSTSDDSWSWRNRGNALLLVAVAAPAIGTGAWLVGSCPNRAAGCTEPGWVPRGLDCLCAWVLDHPIGVVNVLFFVTVCLLFWVISLIQRSSWLIDPYWTLIPLLIAHFYAAHPRAQTDSARSALALALLWVWSVRLTHNYFRREGWHFGRREDWRFAERRHTSRHFWWTSLFTVFLSQQVMLVGLTLPFFAIHTRSNPFGPADVMIGVGAACGIGIAHVADTQLSRFMAANRRRRERGERPVLILDRGLWRLSRHPNYFGEQLFWWAIAAWGVRLGMTWTVVGAAINTLVLVVVTRMVERRMLARPQRTEAFREYRRRTSVWIPWFPRA